MRALHHQQGKRRARRIITFNQCHHERKFFLLNASFTFCAFCDKINQRSGQIFPFRNGACDTFQPRQTALLLEQLGNFTIRSGQAAFNIRLKGNFFFHIKKDVLWYLCLFWTDRRQWGYTCKCCQLGLSTLCCWCESDLWSPGASQSSIFYSGGKKSVLLRETIFTIAPYACMYIYILM